MIRNAVLSLAILAALLLSPVAHGGPVVDLTIGRPVGVVPPVFRFGGGVWRVPKVMRLAEPALTALGEGGTTRAALAWEVLAAAETPEAVAGLLAAYPLNDFLRARAAAGGAVIVTLDATPRWLAADRSEAKAADGPVWARSPFGSEEGWAALVAQIVGHFNGTLGLDAVYEVWNEPDHSLRGDFADYMVLYRATVLGARRADPKARIAGPALSDFTSATGDQATHWYRAFLRRAAATPLPELGLDRLPVDVLTYHAFYRIPATHHRRVVTAARAALADYGYAGTPIWCDEWNIAAEPPYPEGDLNGGFQGAAYIAASLIAMADAGVERQTYQMMIDPGTKGYSGGVLNPAGVPRAAYEAFRLVNLAARGRRLALTGGDGVVQAAAFQTRAGLALLIAVVPPTDVMLARDAFEDTAFASPALSREVLGAGRDALAAYILQDGPLPRLSPKAAAALEAARVGMRASRGLRDTWGAGGTVTVTLPRDGMTVLAHEVINAKTARSGRDIETAGEAVGTLLVERLKATEAYLRREGLDQGIGRRYGDELRARVDGRVTLGQAGDRDAARLRRADALWVAPLAERLEGERKRSADRLRQPAPAITGRVVTLPVESFALHYLLIGG